MQRLLLRKLRARCGRCQSDEILVVLQVQWLAGSVNSDGFASLRLLRLLLKFYSTLAFLKKNRLRRREKGLRRPTALGPHPLIRLFDAPLRKVTLRSLQWGRAG